MNERIKELAEQAEKLSLQYANKNNINFVDAFNIVFAELLIKECTNMLPDDSVRDANGVHMFYVIRKHFGVSEIGR